MPSLEKEKLPPALSLMPKAPNVALMLPETVAVPDAVLLKEKETLPAKPKMSGLRNVTEAEAVKEKEESVLRLP